MDTNIWKPKVEPLPVSTSVPIPSIIKPPSWRPLPDTLKYSFLGDLKTLPVILSSHLDEDQKGKLLDIFSKHKEALGWTIADIEKISPFVECTKFILKRMPKPQENHRGV